ncbi:hypothetical protein LMG24238_03356 [Paraburkholderia sediminicola]|uniref:Uncharacterized protein n=1 Tax=Paraburkholderia sediminicola TaxID=458836 RepID=A0A6J5B7W5_9BURK|nr:hypothetical protein LMG24238_03356 [Paraburkholderia sediminicola]
MLSRASSHVGNGSDRFERTKGVARANGKPYRRRAWTFSYCWRAKRRTARHMSG